MNLSTNKEGSMKNQWLSSQSWQVRDNTAIAHILDIGDILTLEPNTLSGPPEYFFLNYTGQYSFWNGTIFYPVGVNAPKISLHFSWDDSMAPGKQAAGVYDDYKTTANVLRRHANDPLIARMLGYVLVDGHFAIINLFCFQNAQPNGRHWFAIDSQWNQMSPRQDGTGHGDPP
jgi:hypothetical protein